MVVNIAIDTYINLQVQNNITIMNIGHLLSRSYSYVAIAFIGPCMLALSRFIIRSCIDLLEEVVTCNEYYYNNNIILMLSMIHDINIVRIHTLDTIKGQSPCHG